MSTIQGTLIRIPKKDVRDSAKRALEENPGIRFDMRLWSNKVRGNVCCDVHEAQRACEWVDILCDIDSLESLDDVANVLRRILGE